jgi:hypothetical protein
VVTIKDNSGGFWLAGMRKGFDFVIKDDLIPKPVVARLIGKELLSSVKGGTKHKIGVKFVNGQSHWHLFPYGTYSYGIAKRISPDGTPYIPLSDETIRHRKWKAKEGIISVARNRSYILRETGKHIFNGMEVSLVIPQRGQTRIEIRFKDADSLAIAKIQNEGKLGVKTPWFKKTKVSDIPARPFIGIQQEFIDNLEFIINQL